MKKEYPKTSKIFGLVVLVIGISVIGLREVHANSHLITQLTMTENFIKSEKASEGQALPNYKMQDPPTSQIDHLQNQEGLFGSAGQYGIGSEAGIKKTMIYNQETNLNGALNDASLPLSHEIDLSDVTINVNYLPSSTLLIVKDPYTDPSKVILETQNSERPNFYKLSLPNINKLTDPSAPDEIYYIQKNPLEKLVIVFSDKEIDVSLP